MVIEIPPNTSVSALRTFFNIVKQWKLGADEARVLLGVPSTTFLRWKKAAESATLSRDTLERISCIFGIYKALHTIYAEPAVADDWLRRRNDNPLFDGQAPLTRMLSGCAADLLIVRQHLDAHVFE